jgi:uncharacterized protein YbcI
VSDTRYLEQRDGSVNAAIANAVVHTVREYTGRGPTHARAAISGDLVTVLMGDLLTKAERNLAQNGKADLVLHVRKEFQRTMRDELIAGVEALTQRKVIAFMSDNHIDPDMAVESFVLEPRPEPVSAPPSE